MLKLTSGSQAKGKKREDARKEQIRGIFCVGPGDYGESQR